MCFHSLGVPHSCKTDIQQSLQQKWLCSGLSYLNPLQCFCGRSLQIIRHICRLFRSYSYLEVPCVLTASPLLSDTYNIFNLMCMINLPPMSTLLWTLVVEYRKPYTVFEVSFLFAKNLLNFLLFCLHLGVFNPLP